MGFLIVSTTDWDCERETTKIIEKISQYLPQALTNSPDAARSQRRHARSAVQEQRPNAVHKISAWLRQASMAPSYRRKPGSNCPRDAQSSRRAQKSQTYSFLRPTALIATLGHFAMLMWKEAGWNGKVAGFRTKSRLSGISRPWGERQWVVVDVRNILSNTISHTKSNFGLLEMTSSQVLANDVFFWKSRRYVLPVCHLVNTFDDAGFRLKIEMSTFGIVGRH